MYITDVYLFSSIYKIQVHMDLTDWGEGPIWFLEQGASQANWQHCPRPGPIPAVRAELQAFVEARMKPAGCLSVAFFCHHYTVVTALASNLLTRPRRRSQDLNL
jgi:hypothetical protein